MIIHTPQAPITDAWLFAQNCDFIAGAGSRESLPPAQYPELAFAGRSNVGKSSLVNALTGRRTLARTSGAPGHTRQLNFFLLAGRLMLVDMPGYGYAKAPKAMIAAWEGLVRDYLRGRPNLRRVLLLIDARHGIKPPDEAIMKLLDEAAAPFQIVLTKCDKADFPPPAGGRKGGGHAGKAGDSKAPTPALPLQEREIRIVLDELSAILKKHPAAMPQIIATSAVTKDGIEALRESLVELAQP